MKNVLITLVVISILGVAWWLGSPLFLDKEVDEEFPTDAQESGTGTSDRGIAEVMTVGDVEPKLIAAGLFRDADNFHQGSGRATLLSLEEGNTILRLEDFMVTNGPDLFVLLSPESDPAHADALGEYVELGRLKGNIGNQNYTLPDGIDPAAYHSVIIYCKAFHVVFSVASLS